MKKNLSSLYTFSYCARNTTEREVAAARDNVEQHVAQLQRVSSGAAGEVAAALEELQETRLQHADQVHAVRETEHAIDGPDGIGKKKKSDRELDMGSLAPPSLHRFLVCVARLLFLLSSRLQQ